MDEPADFVKAVAGVRRALTESSDALASGIDEVAKVLTLTTKGMGALTLSCTNAQSAACWGVYSIDGRTIIAPSVSAAMRTTPPRRLGWEGYGPQAKDDPESNHVDTAMKRMADAVERMHREMAGAKVANAITAIHNQQPRDGRPARYIPETA